MSLRLDSIQLKNLRSLKDTGFIQLKPITVLVGKNSVGKSTFLRSFPLIRQSCERQKRAPILWYGKLVDFGDFKTALNRTAAKKNEPFIGFKFKFEVFGVGNHSRLNFQDIKGSNDYVDLKIDVKNKDEKTYISNLMLYIDNKTIKFIFEFKQGDSFLRNISVDDVVLFEQDDNNILLNISQNNLLPRIEVNVFNIEDYFYDYDILMSSDLEKVSLVILYDYLKRILINQYGIIPNEYLSSLKNLVILLIKSKKNISNEESVRDYMLTFFIQSKSRLFIDDLYNDNKFVSNVVNIFKLDEYVDLIQEMDYSLNSFYSSVRYLEPLRATAQRYYRAQELSIDEIDSRGSNVPMFLDNLSSHQLDQLRKFIKKHFNISVNVKKEGGHLALTITNQENGVDTNIADLGVGYSQLLPFLVQFWDLYIKARRNERLYLGSYRSRSQSSQKKFLLIEQPELHLHPAYQVKTVDMVVDLISSMKSKSLGIIMETHSPNIIYRLSELIESEQLNNEDVQILIFDEADGQTNITEATFNNEGDLINWPTGFFQV